ncbi:hypothetical protein FHS18_006050 [Paenibacillus phyllosphaerae]|uniref:DUF2332 domain-containing protein n=1 Tax=Paenibacillus phyllosphaerae TaxID=274593 RepID=A0A7W5B4D3_9BACL|nr:hypothetical protein [Paenibacillus phyllosphaerae]
MLYEQLARGIANDAFLLELAAHARPGQPAPNLLLGAVHYLLLKGTDHALARYYASIVTEPESPSGAMKWFRTFCQQYRAELMAILATKRVQTNEVQRCAYLYPSFCHIYRLARKPLALIEIGTSAGLQLLWDQYGYSYPTGHLYGNQQASLVLTSTIKGDQRPFLLEQSPPVTVRIGIDLQLSKETEYRFSRGLSQVSLLTQPFVFFIRM